MDNIPPQWTLGERLAKARKDAGLTSYQIAAALGISRVTATNWENNTTVPRRYAIEAWARASNCDAYWIEFGLTEDQMAEVERLGAQPGEVVVVPTGLPVLADRQGPRNRCSFPDVQPQRPLPFDGVIFVGAGPLLDATTNPPMHVFNSAARAKQATHESEMADAA